MLGKKAVALLKSIWAMLGGVALALLAGGVGGRISKALLTGGDEDNRANAIPGVMIGTLVGVALGGWTAGRLLRLLRRRVGLLGCVFVGPGPWIWLVFVGPWLDFDHLAPQLCVAAVLLVPSVIGVLVGVGRAKSAGHEADRPGEEVGCVRRAGRWVVHPDEDAVVQPQAPVLNRPILPQGLRCRIKSLAGSWVHS